MPEVIIYANERCPFCIKAKKLLDAEQVEYTLKDVDADPSLWQEIETLTGRNTIPQIFIGDRHVGGCDELYLADRSGELQIWLKG